MHRTLKRSIRAASLLLVLPLLAVTCGEAVAELPPCPASVTQEPTGDLAVDIVGAWSGSTNEKAWHHPIAYMAGEREGATDSVVWSGHRVWMFRSDGSGHVWWVVNGESSSLENDEEFVWEVADGELVVDDFPPATIEIRSEIDALIHPIDESVDPLRGLSILRCDLEVPDDVRGFDL